MKDSDMEPTINSMKSEAYKEYDRQRKRVANQNQAERDRVSRRMKSPQWELKSKVKAVIRRCIKNKTDCTSEELGYSAQDFRQHISSLFTEGMTWDNYGEWHIDHIIPVIWFYENGIHDMKEISALTNMQPMWGKDNMSKGVKIDTLAGE